jgi:hypothetical protein
MSSLSVDYKNQCSLLALEKARDPRTATSRWVLGKLSAKDEAIEEIFLSIKTSLAPSLSDTKLRAQSYALLKEARSSFKLLDFLEAHEHSGKLDERDRSVIGADPGFMKRAVAEEMVKQGILPSITLAECIRRPELISKTAFIWDTCMESAKEWKIVLDTLVEARSRELHESHGASGLQLRSLDRTADKPACTAAFLRTLDVFREDPFAHWMRSTSFSSFLEASLTWYETYVSAESPSPAGMALPGRQLMVRLAGWKSFIRELLASDKADTLTPTQKKFLRSVLESKLVVFKLQELFEKNIRTMFVDTPSCALAGTVERALRDEELFASTDFELPGGAHIPFLNVLRKDIHRSVGQRIIVKHTEEGAEKMTIPNETIPDDDASFDKHVRAKQATILSHLSSLSPHAKGFDRKFNELLQFLLSQEGFGIRIGDALFFTTKDHLHTIK